MTDHVWAVRVGTLDRLRATIKKFHTKKFAKLGFYVEIEELGKQDNDRLIRAYQKREDFMYNNKAIPFALINSDMSENLLRSITTGSTKQYYVAKFLGPKLLNGVPRAN